MLKCLLLYILLLALLLRSMTATYGFVYGVLFTKRELKGTEKDRDDEVSTEADCFIHFSWSNRRIEKI